MRCTSVLIARLHSFEYQFDSTKAPIVSRCRTVVWHSIPSSTPEYFVSAFIFFFFFFISYFYSMIGEFHEIRNEFCEVNCEVLTRKFCVEITAGFSLYKLANYSFQPPFVLNRLLSIAAAYSISGYPGLLLDSHG